MSGPLPTSQCSVCNHAQSSAINAAIAGGRPLRRVAVDFALGKDAVNRHVKNQHPGAPVPAGATPKGLPTLNTQAGATPHERMENLARALEEQVGSGPVSPLLAQALRQAYNDLAKLKGPPPPSEVTMKDVQGLGEFVADLFEALEPFPDARRAMKAVIDKHRESLGG